MQGWIGIPAKCRVASILSKKKTEIALESEEHEAGQRLSLVNMVFQTKNMTNGFGIMYGTCANG